MGIFDFFKGKTSKDKIRESYLIMSKYELLNLNDGDLYDAIQERLIQKEEAFNHNISQLISELTREEVVVYTAMCFVMEENNGGLSQYLSNNSRYTAPYLLESLKAIKAKGIHNLLANYVKAFEIDLNHPKETKIEEIIDLFFDFSYDDFDNEFYDFQQQQDLCQLIVDYIREHIDSFAN